MHQTFFEFVESPSRETYLNVRGWLLGGEAYDPYTDDLADIVQMVQEGQYARAELALNASMPNLLLSPRAHLLAAAIAAHRGDPERAEAERFVATACVQGILATGDGSPQQPYLALRTCDEYDLLDFLGKELAEQDLHHAGDRHLELVRTTDGAELWFDLTDAYNRLSERRVFEQLERLFRDPPAE